MFKKHGLKMNLDKTEVMWGGKQREELNIMLKGMGEWMWKCDAE